MSCQMITKLLLLFFLLLCHRVCGGQDNISAFSPTLRFYRGKTFPSCYKTRKVDGLSAPEEAEEDTTRMWKRRRKKKKRRKKFKEERDSMKEPDSTERGYETLSDSAVEKDGGKSGVDTPEVSAQTGSEDGQSSRRRNREVVFTGIAQEEDETRSTSKSSTKGRYKHGRKAKKKTMRKREKDDLSTSTSTWTSSGEIAGKEERKVGEEEKGRGIPIDSVGKAFAAVADRDKVEDVDQEGLRSPESREGDDDDDDSLSGLPVFWEVGVYKGVKQNQGDTKRDQEKLSNRGRKYLKHRKEVDDDPFSLSSDIECDSKVEVFVERRRNREEDWAAEIDVDGVSLVINQQADKRSPGKTFRKIADMNNAKMEDETENERKADNEASRCDTEGKDALPVAEAGGDKMNEDIEGLSRDTEIKPVDAIECRRDTGAENSMVPEDKIVKEDANKSKPQYDLLTPKITKTAANNTGISGRKRSKRKQTPKKEKVPTEMKKRKWDGNPQSEKEKATPLKKRDGLGQLKGTYWEGRERSGRAKSRKLVWERRKSPAEGNTKVSLNRASARIKPQRFKTRVEEDARKKRACSNTRTESEMLLDIKVRAESREKHILETANGKGDTQDGVPKREKCSVTEPEKKLVAGRKTRLRKISAEREKTKEEQELEKVRRRKEWK